MTEQRKVRWLHRRSRTMRGTQKHAVSFGINVGYWPCLRGPFIKIEFATHRIDLWFGTPSNEVPIMLSPGVTFVSPAVAKYVTPKMVERINRPRKRGSKP